MTALITREELRVAIDAGNVTVVDALAGEYYAKQHLPGAVPLHPGEVAARATEVLPDRTATIVTYCSNPACPNSGQVADALTRLGYTDVRKYKEGIQDWVEAGLPTESL
ncbi:rhodanese-like domain-containing protein [Yinghuangia seranimata]|uniref:rhodanese-like domain-containing protein n=1 Tax=Yinghuangia seranimata TaxID=408067 RepID=UPI00248CE475|nr:rhodanese-like domain-containing protein [Yinghuangia seranimata]MDI2131498.1 rhodanese-like domain-containing protein [Yinghuangia seranimata]